MDPNKPTYYQTLQIDENASDPVIRASYRALIQKYHPDRYIPTDEGERISRLINHAYHILSDSNRRRKYDAELRQKREQNSRAAHSSASTSPESPSSSTTSTARNKSKSEKPLEEKSTNLAFFLKLVLFTVLIRFLGLLGASAVMLAMLYGWHKGKKRSLAVRYLYSGAGFVVGIIAWGTTIMLITENKIPVIPISSDQTRTGPNSTSNYSRNTFPTQQSRDTKILIQENPTSPSVASFQSDESILFPKTIPPNKNEYIQTIYARVTAQQLNMRSGPGTKHEVIKKLYYAAPVKILENTESDWIKVKHFDKEGYINKNFIKPGDLQKTLENLCPISITHHGEATGTQSHGNNKLTITGALSADAWVLLLDQHSQKTLEIYIEKRKTVYINGLNAGYYTVLFHSGLNYSEKCRSFINNDIHMVQKDKLEIALDTNKNKIQVPSYQDKNNYITFSSTTP